MKNYEFLKTMEYPFSTLKAYKIFGEDSWYYSHKVVLSFFLVSIICFQETEMWSVFQFSQSNREDLIEEIMPRSYGEAFLKKKIVLHAVFEREQLYNTPDLL